MKTLLAFFLLLFALPLVAAPITNGVEAYGPFAVTFPTDGSPPLAVGAIGGQRFLLWVETAAGYDWLSIAPLGADGVVDRSRIAQVTPGIDPPGSLTGIATAATGDGSTLYVAWSSTAARAYFRRFTRDLRAIDAVPILLGNAATPVGARPTAGWNGRQIVIAFGANVAFFDASGAAPAPRTMTATSMVPAATTIAANGSDTLAAVYEQPGITCTPGGFGIFCFLPNPTTRLVLVERAAGATIFNFPSPAPRVVAAAAAGRYAAVWKSGPSLFLMPIDASGKPGVARALADVNADFPRVLSVAGSGDEWLVAWEDRAAGRPTAVLALADASGRLVDGPLALAPYESAFAPAVARTGDGAYTIAYLVRVEAGWVIRTRLVTTKEPGRRRP